MTDLIRVKHGSPASSFALNRSFGSVDKHISEVGGGVIPIRLLALRDVTTHNITVGGAITFATSHGVLVSNSGVTDNLDDISGGSDNDLLFIRPQTGHTITVRHGIGNIYLKSGVDLELPDSGYMLLRKSGSVWGSLVVEGANITRSAVRVRRAAAQSIGTGSITNISFDTEDYDDNSYFAAGSPTQLSLAAGRWLMSGYVSFATDPAATVRVVGFQANVTAFSAWATVNHAGQPSVYSFLFPIYVSSSFTFNLRARQDSGGNLDVTALLNATRMDT